jgi:hypothetical protein
MNLSDSAVHCGLMEQHSPRVESILDWALGNPHATRHLHFNKHGYLTGPYLNSTVAYRPIAQQWLCKHRPLLGNVRNIHARNNRRTAFSIWSAPQLMLCNEVNTPLQQQQKKQRWCFLRRPCWGVILKTNDATGVSSGFTWEVLSSGQRKQNNLHR